MKSWFQNANKKIRYFLHGLMFLIMATTLFLVSYINLSSLAETFIALFFVLALGFEIFFIYCEKNKKSKNVDHTNKTIPKQINRNDFSIDKSNEASRTIFDDVTIIDTDGNIKKVPEYYKIIDNDYCLICEGGKTYHSHCNCYKKWKPEYAANFKNWEIISIDEAKKRGMKKCSFCLFEDMTDEEKIKYKTKGRAYFIVELAGFSNEDIQTNIGCVDDFQELYIEYDFDKDRYAVLDGTDIVGYLKNQDLKKILTICDDIESAEVYCYKTISDDYLQYRIKVLIIGN